MKNLVILLIFIFGFTFHTVNAGSKQKVIWTAVFSRGIPINSKISQVFCDRHTPTVMITTIDQITSKEGVKALNGVIVRYLSYKELQKDHLNFNIVQATVKGKGKNGKEWSLPMKLYEQTLNPIDVTYTVWSTPYCKGTFLGTPTIA